ncbi:ArsR/SmtB family transcription factor [Specibacter sp. NPDC057265]|uniref:ArsR/SmtB family transcription factor n=1 Tax=Specibacter sp. NPDC057265 TaxID=3346075 RepID=UPI003626B043
MVIDQSSEAAVDRLFQALSDATRRDIVRRVAEEPLSLTALAAFHAMSFTAVHKHVAVLERASLITKEKRGREQLVLANPQGLALARRLLDEYEEIWRQRAIQIDFILTKDEE